MSSFLLNETDVTTEESGHGPGDCSSYGTPGFSEVTFPERGKSAIMLLVLIIVPNILVILLTIWSLKRSKGTTLSVPKVLILILAFTDCTFGVTDVLTQTLRYTYGFCAIGGQVACTAQAFFSNILLQMSLLLVGLMSAERYSSLVFPFKHTQLFSMPNTAKIIVGLFSMSSIVSLLPIIGINEYVYGQFGCDFQWADSSPLGRGYAYFRGIMMVVFLCAILSLNMICCYKVYQMQFKVAPCVTGETNKQETNTKVKKTTTKDQVLQRKFMVLVILTSLASILCNTPYMVSLIGTQMSVSNLPVPTFIIKRMFLSNSIVNPVLMLMFYISLFLKCPPGRHVQDESQTTFSSTT